MSVEIKCNNKSTLVTAVTITQNGENKRAFSPKDEKLVFTIKTQKPTPAPTVAPPTAPAATPKPKPTSTVPRTITGEDGQLLND